MTWSSALSHVCIPSICIITQAVDLILVRALDPMSGKRENSAFHSSGVNKIEGSVRKDQIWTSHLLMSISFSVKYRCCFPIKGHPGTACNHNKAHRFPVSIPSGNLSFKCLMWSRDSMSKQGDSLSDRELQAKLVNNLNWSYLDFKACRMISLRAYFLWTLAENPNDWFSKPNCFSN